MAAGRGQDLVVRPVPSWLLHWQDIHLVVSIPIGENFGVEKRWEGGKTGWRDVFGDGSGLGGGLMPVETATKFYNFLPCFGNCFGYKSPCFLVNTVAPW